MQEIYNVLLQKYGSRLTPVHCAEQTVVQLHRYFEDVVLENNLAALVVEALPPQSERPAREFSRVRDIGRVARHSFFFVTPQDALNKRPLRDADEDRESMLIIRPQQGQTQERFLVVADPRFSAVLASIKTPPTEEGAVADDSIIWTFEHDIVLFALDFLIARTRTESPEQAEPLTKTIRATIPKEASSQWMRAANYLSAAKTQLTVSVATELARLLQEQAGREVAINRIANAIRSSLEIKNVLQTTVNEVGRALKAQCCALRIGGEASTSSAHAHSYVRKGSEREVNMSEVAGDLDAYQAYLANHTESYAIDGSEIDGAVGRRDRNPSAVVPLIYQQRFMGVLLVQSDDPHRVWQENERLLLSTVAGQVSVAVKQARLFAQMQHHALTDGLTGCLNRRSFEMHLEHDLQLAVRSRQFVSLIMIDVDHFKRVNDTFGHDSGDVALRAIAEMLRREIRSMDMAARYGGEEFAVILPQAGIEDAEMISERLRSSIEKMDIPGVGRITASLGIATFPIHATTREQLVTIADRALYSAKHAGRNRVCTAPLPPPPPLVGAEPEHDAEQSPPEALHNLSQSTQV